VRAKGRTSLSGPSLATPDFLITESISSGAGSAISDGPIETARKIKTLFPSPYVNHRLT